MLNQKSGGNNKWEGLTRTVVVLVAVMIVFAASGVVGAQEKAAGSAEVISLNVTQMNLQDVLRLIAEKANLNIIVSKEVSGVVSVRLKNVNLWDALGAILETNDFSYREEKGIIRVRPAHSDYQNSAGEDKGCYHKLMVYNKFFKPNI